jgi:hypothetical protein
MKQIQKTQPLNISTIDKKEESENSLLEKQKKEKMLTIGVYSLIIIITVALMLILFNLIIKS